ncbi:hypothetical protein ABLT31_17525 [Ammoniphilus sp. 3BR4]
MLLDGLAVHRTGSLGYLFIIKNPVIAVSAKDSTVVIRGFPIIYERRITGPVHVEGSVAPSIIYVIHIVVIDVIDITVVEIHCAWVIEIISPCRTTCSHHGT